MPSNIMFTFDTAYLDKQNMVSWLIWFVEFMQRVKFHSKIFLYLLVRGMMVTAITSWPRGQGIDPSSGLFFLSESQLLWFGDVIVHSDELNTFLKAWEEDNKS